MDKQSDNAFGVHAWALMIIFENDLGDETEDDSFFCYWQPPNGKKMAYENNYCKFLQKHFH